MIEKEVIKEVEVVVEKEVIKEVEVPVVVEKVVLVATPTPTSQPVTQFHYKYNLPMPRSFSEAPELAEWSARSCSSSWNRHTCSLPWCLHKYWGTQVFAFSGFSPVRL